MSHTIVEQKKCIDLATCKAELDKCMVIDLQSWHALPEKRDQTIEPSSVLIQAQEKNCIGLISAASVKPKLSYVANIAISNGSSGLTSILKHNLVHGFARRVP